MEDLLEQSLEGALAFALLWGAGGTLPASERPAFDAAFRSLHAGQLDVLERMDLWPPEPPAGSPAGKNNQLNKRSRRFSQHLPPTGSCFDIFWDLQQKKWNTWSSLPMLPDVRRGAAVTSAALQQVLIETPETALLQHFLCLIPAGGTAHLLLAGDAGGGKSKCMLQLLHRMAVEGQQDYLQQLDGRELTTIQQKLGDTLGKLVSKAQGLPNPLMSDARAFSFLALSLTGATNPSTVQHWLEGRLEKRRAGGLRPASFPRAVLLLDDVHLPATEESGAQPAGELLRQLLECGGWTQRGTWRFCSVEGITLSATCRAVQQQQQQLNDRLTRHFFPIMAMPYSPESLQFILHQILLLRFHKCSDAVVAGLRTVAALTTRLYRQVQERLPPRPARWMQQWTPRDGWRVIQRLAVLNSVGLHSQQQLLCCWLHEARRVFEDRTAVASDLDVLSGVITDVLEDTAHVSLADLEPPGKGPLLFAFRETEAGATAGAASAAATVEDCILGSRVYERVTPSEAHSLCAAGLEQYSLLHPKAPLSLVLFPQAVEHSVRCMNTLLHPQGHALLLGVGGSGRRSAARLAAFLAGFGTMEPHGASHSITISEWLEDAKSAILATGALRKRQLLLVQAEHLAHDQVAAHVCTLLQLRELPDIFTADEKVCNSHTLVIKGKNTGFAGQGTEDVE